MPDSGLDVSQVAGNVPDYIKRLNSNTFAQYGVGDADCFAYPVGKAVRFVEASINHGEERTRKYECTTVYEVTVGKGGWGVDPKEVAGVNVPPPPRKVCLMAPT